MVKAIGNSSQPLHLTKSEKKTKEPEQAAPAPAPAPAPPPEQKTDSDSLTTSQGGLDPKVAFTVSQGLRKNPEDEPIGELSPTQTRTGTTAEEGENTLKKGKEAPEKGEGGKKEEKPSPTETTDKKDGPMDRDKAIEFVTKNFDKFDTGAGIGGTDGLFSGKDLNKLAEGDDELAEAANVLIDEDIIGELGGGDGKISRMDWTEVQKPVDDIKIETEGLDDDQVKDLEKSLKLLESDPDGSKLLDKIRKDGYTIKYDGEYNKKDDNNANAYHQGSSKTIGITEKFFEHSFEEQTGILGHEMLHAATNADGNSRTEEGYAEAIERRIAARVGRDQLSENGEIDYFNSKYNLESYADLKEDNGVRDSLEDLGITFSWSPGDEPEPPPFMPGMFGFPFPMR